MSGRRGGRGRGGSRQGGTGRARPSGGPRRNGGGGPNRGRSSGGTPRRRGGGGGNGADNERNSNNNRHTDNGAMPGMRDEEILIAFMPHLKSGNAEAAKIYEEYQIKNDQESFVRRARHFLASFQQQQTSTRSPAPSPVAPQREPKNLFPHRHGSLAEPHTNGGSSQHQLQQQQQLLLQRTQQQHQQQPIIPPQRQQQPLLPQQPVPQQQTLNPQSQFGASAGPADPVSLLFPNLSPDHQSVLTPPRNTIRQQQFASANDQVLNMSSVEDSLNSLLSSSTNTNPPQQPPGVNHDPIINMSALPTGVSAIWGAAPSNSRPSQPTPAPIGSFSRANSTETSPNPSPWKMSGPLTPPSHLSLSPTGPSQSRSMTDDISNKTERTPPVPPTPKKEAPTPKRLWTHFEEQPGRITVKGVSGQDSSVVLALGPRDELVANWSLPVQYLQSKTQANRLERALDGLTIGLFRRGCTENGTQASIISKAVLGDEKRSYEYWKEGNVVCGRVPFFSPRTPGYVVFRMYSDDEPIYTLGMGPSLHVRVLENDFEPSIRFILSNFKGKKSNPTSLSSLHSLAVVLETQLSRPNESAARATWGCIQEARKVIDACFAEYSKTTMKMAQLEDDVEDLKKQVEDEQETKSQALSMISDPDGEQQSTDGVPDSEAAIELKEKTKLLMSGRASCERKWRDSQLAFASILKAVVTNPTMPILLRRDQISKMRIEFELWCPLSEEFASPESTGVGKIWYESMRELSHPITAEDFTSYGQARNRMQMRTLSFEPNTTSLDDVLFPRNRGAPNQRNMDAGAVSVFNTMSAAMGNYYHELFADEDKIIRKREMIRERVDHLVNASGQFPPNARVVIFGSAANGFGSPKSDIDMCLQLSGGTGLQEEDPSGADAMSKLGTFLEESGMKHVDTSRLTARIPILKFQCPNPFSNGEEDLIEVDLSMQNPLAVLNTSYLRCYAEVTPITRVLASIIKRWAKARDINNPARHTLSSYGYIIMLLHFLTFHKRTGNGLVSQIAHVDGNPDIRNQRAPQPTPLLPNFHWINPRWPNAPKGTPYIEMPSIPRQMIKHPLVEGKTVNTYYCRPSTPESKVSLQTQFSGQDLSLGILLASFFRYFAFEFDYKRHVVSLHSTAARGIVEREVKAELDGWRNYSAALTIEDPFETFYDVAHVLRGGYYHRIRREFAVAYTKIADAASGRAGSWNKGDLRSMSGSELIDWLCESVTTEREQQTP